MAEDDQWRDRPENKGKPDNRPVNITRSGRLADGGEGKDPEPGQADWNAKQDSDPSYWWKVD
jgi:hypothetical protein